MELQSRATSSIAVLHSRWQLGFKTRRQNWAEAEIQISALFPVSEQGHARRYKAPHSMGRIPPSPPYSFRPRKKHWINPCVALPVHARIVATGHCDFEASTY